MTFPHHKVIMALPYLGLGARLWQKFLCKKLLRQQYRSILKKKQNKKDKKK